MADDVKIPNVVTKAVSCGWPQSSSKFTCAKKAADFIAEKQDYYCKVTPILDHYPGGSVTTASILIICNKRQEPQACEKKAEK